MNVKLFRLNSGEEILARFEDQGDSWLIKDPAILIPVGEGQIGLMPWMIYTKASKGVSIPKSFIAFTVEPLDELKNQYDSSLNRGIVTPRNKIDPPAGNPKLKLVT
jgi:hypothetical protein